MMYPNIKSFPIYWENGMKLSATHFQHLENSIEDAVRDSRAIGLGAGGAFGLLPFSPLKIRNAQGATPQSVRVILEACRAVLPGGYRVEILPENINQLKLPTQAPYVEFVPASNVRYHIFLSVNEQRRVPAGIPQTRPIRHPHLSLAYHLECIPQDKLSAVRNLAPNRIKIAEWQKGKVVEGYIPPCLTIKGFSLLEKWHQFLQNQLVNIVRVSLQVIKEYRRKDVARAAFCTPIVHFIKSSQGYFKWQLPHQAPINLIAYYGDLAGLVDGLIDTCDRDFVRTMLKDGQAFNLKKSIHELLKIQMVPTEEMAILLNILQQLSSAILATIQSLITYVPPTPKMGDRNHNIASG
ncbi:MAG: hypothetical protein AAGJ18_01895 [Bacteroidota bacterium]